MQPENVLVAAIRRAIRREYPDSLTLKVHGGPYQEAGIPDILVVVDGRFIGLEVKRRRPGESDSAARDRATAQQRAMLARMEAAGGVARVVLSEDEALAAIREAL